MKDKWEYFDGNFTADKYNDTLLKYSPWSGHRRFGYDLVSYYEPENLVELGSFYGCSTFAFMQAIKENNLKTKIFPVDLWEAGDKFTIHDYEQDVYGFFTEIYEREFSSVYTRMMKMSFDNALPDFENGSIDVLHIDGSHAYEDVRHDFESWLPKVKDKGIVLFHDISEQLLYGKTLGSCIFWKEIREKFSFTVEMQHSWGLGILFLSEKKYKDFLDKVDLSHYLKMCICDENLAKDRIRTDYFKLQDANKWISSLKRDKEAADQDNTRLLAEICRIKESYKEADHKKSIYIKELEEAISGYEQTVEAKDTYTEELKEAIQKYERTVEAKDVYVEELIGTIGKYEQTVEAKDVYVEELKETIKRYEQTTEEKDSYAEELKDTIKNYAQAVQAKDAYIGDLKETICGYENTFAGKDRYIEELSETIRTYNLENQNIKSAYEQTIQKKEAYVEELQETIQKYEETFTGKDRYIEELQAAVKAYKEENQNIKSAYERTIQGKDTYIKELEATRKTRRKDRIYE